jgi:hypothetical protein
VALVLLQLGLEALEQREGVGGGAGKTGQHLVAVELAHLARAGLDDDVAERDLAVAAQGDDGATAHAHDGGAVKGFHEVSQLRPRSRPSSRRFSSSGPEHGNVR